MTTDSRAPFKGTFSTVFLFGLATYENSAAGNWKKSAEQMHVKAEYVAMGERWRGFRWGLQQLRDTLISMDDLPDDTLVVKSDVYDVLVQSTQEQIIKKYHSAVENYRKYTSEVLEDEESQLTVNPLLVGLEATCGLNGAPFHPTIESQDRRYINAGVWAGSKTEVLKMLDWCIENGGDDDQIALGKYTKEHLGSVAADLRAEFVLMPHAIDREYPNLTISESGIVCENDDICAAFLHFPGINCSWKMELYNRIARARDLTTLVVDYTPALNKARHHCIRALPYTILGILTLFIIGAIVAMIISAVKNNSKNDGKNISSPVSNAKKSASVPRELSS